MFGNISNVKTLTNFDNEKLPLYNLAVSIHNKKRGENILAISNIAIYGENNNISEGSSCLIQIGNDSMNSFWKLLDELQEIINKY